MLRGIIFTVVIVSATALLNNHRELTRDFSYLLPENEGIFNINKKNFSNEEEALKDLRETFNKIHDVFNLPSLTFDIFMHEKKSLYSDALKEGYLDLENNVTVTFNSKYRLCSISKTFTSAIIGQLVDQGKLTYDTPINSVLKSVDFPVKQWQNKPVNITVGQLLSHTAGVHITSFDDFNKVVLSDNATQMIHKFKDEPLRFKPGTKFEYSNYGFQLLSAVVEAVTKQTFVDVVYKLLHKNDLNDTYVETSDLLIKHRARNYRHVHSVTENLPTMVFDDLFMAEGWYAAGGILSNINNLIKWGRMMLDAYKGKPNAILSQKTVREMWTPHSEVPLPGNQTQVQTAYGYGWFITNITHVPSEYEINHRHFIWHSGGLVGSSSMLMIYPEEEIVGVAFTNKGYVAGLDQLIMYAVENLYDLRNK